MEQWIFCTVHFHLEFWTGQISVQQSSLPLRYSPSLKSPQHTDPIPGCLHRCNPAVAFPASRIELVPRAQSPALPHASTHWCAARGGRTWGFSPDTSLCVALCQKGRGDPLLPCEQLGRVHVLFIGLATGARCWHWTAQIANTCPGAFC